MKSEHEQTLVKEMMLLLTVSVVFMLNILIKIQLAEANSIQFKALNLFKNYKKLVLNI